MVQFGDLRGWIEALRREGELHQIDTEVDWDCELGTITRRVFGNGDGPALLFSNIKDYNKNTTRCSAMALASLAGLRYFSSFTVSTPAACNRPA